MQTLSPRAQIACIDRQIDAVRKELFSKILVDRSSARSWQAAWDRFPALRARESELFRQRGEAQLQRDLTDAAAASRAARSARLRKSKCAACGSTIFAKAA